MGDQLRGNHEQAEASILPFPKVGSPPARRSDGGAHVDDLRSVLGEVLRDERRSQSRTLAEVAGDAVVSVGYLSEVERGRKDVSSEVLGAVTRSLEVPLATVLERCAERLRAGSQRASRVELRAA